MCRLGLLISLPALHSLESTCGTYMCAPPLGRMHGKFPSCQAEVCNTFTALLLKSGQPLRHPAR